LFVAVLLRKDRLFRKLALAAGFAIPAAVAAALPLMGTPLLKAAKAAIKYESWWAFMSTNHMPYLKAIPDIVIAGGALIVIGTLLLRVMWRSLQSGPQPAISTSHDTSDTSDEAHAAKGRTSLLFSLGYLQLVAFAGFFFVAPYFCRLEFYCLPRYFVFLLPLLLFGWMRVISQVSRRVAITSMSVAMAWFVVNYDGAWYPTFQPNNGAMAERAASYRRLAEVQQAAVQSTARLPADDLLLYGLPEHYFLHHPWLATKPHPGGRCITFEKERPASLAINDLPDRFYVLVDAVILGGRELRKVVRDAKADPTRQVKVVGCFVQEPYRISLYEISRAAQPTEHVVRQASLP
jgi:hypothetical protein